MNAEVKVAEVPGSNEDYFWIKYKKSISHWSSDIWIYKYIRYVNEILLKYIDIQFILFHFEF